MGFMPEAVLNFWDEWAGPCPTNGKKFSLGEMIEHFDIQRVSLGGPIFDQEKLRWLNGLWIRENLSADQFVQRITALVKE